MDRFRTPASQILLDSFLGPRPVVEDDDDFLSADGSQDATNENHPPGKQTNGK
jgi:hypothetical protein